MATRLVFSRAPLTGPPWVLVFGEDDVPAPEPAEATLDAAFEGLIVEAIARPVHLAALEAAFGDLVVEAVAVYDNLVTRYLQRGPVCTHQSGIVAEHDFGASWAISERQLGGISAHWQPAAALAQGVSVASSAALAKGCNTSASWAWAARQQAQVGIAHQRADGRAVDTRGRYELGEARERITVSRMQAGIELRLHRSNAWKTGVPVEHLHRGRSGASLQRLGRQADVVRWQQAMRPRAGRSYLPVTPPGDPCYLPSTRLVFSAPWSSDTRLVFECERHDSAAGPVARIVIPILRTYVTINSISLHRVDTGAELHAHGFSMSLDADSWTWSWSASLHHDAANHLGRDAQGDPAELAVLVNGIPFRLRLGTVSRDRRFSPTRWAVSGKGKAAILGAPYAPRRSFGNTAPRTAQQLMADVLTINGVSLGWTVDWGLTDWLVPELAWSLQGSYIEAINDIAAAAGGYVQPHATDAVLRVLPRYPAAPWAWDSITPDFEIPADAAEVEGTEYVDKPTYNRVFVGGVGAGVFGSFKRAGTAGDLLAPQVTHALITHADAHRQRGLAELSDTGRQEHITLKMQVLPETGIITPGQFVRYLGDETVMGIVRSTSIDWSRPVLRQTLRLETHA